MNRNMRAVVALAGATVVGLLASPALANESGFCDSEEMECPHSPPPPPPPPSIPNAVSTNGNYSVSLGSIQNSEFRQGVYQNGQTTFFGGGPLVPVGNNGVLTVGQTNNSITLAPTMSGATPSVTVTAIATTPQDPNFPDFDLVARGGVQLGYLVAIHAHDQAGADALNALLSTNGAIAGISGAYSLTATGSSWGSVSAATGTDQLANGLGGSFSQTCSPIGYFGDPNGCGAGTYSLALNFVSGSVYEGGSGLDFYSAISLSASANAGPPDLGYDPGTFTAFIDPMITFGAGIDLSDYDLSVGGVSAPLVGATPPAPGVPEPAAWAMMLMGFGGLGAVLRHRRARAALA